ncbi:hypothetical protein RJ639_025838 [Escallonia herrerae]|uniref:Uncharacterized protein n=1 Tax=Escallonia herrerae TaxID=1293975 RepID=A0AA88S752_9ASTE|nr:hypothetical protein RJ639_025838 [Escallonia herrerae]
MRKESKSFGHRHVRDPCRSFGRRCGRLVKEQRARFYILRRCVTMLRLHGKERSGNRCQRQRRGLVDATTTMSGSWSVKPWYRRLGTVDGATSGKMAAGGDVIVATDDGR